MTFATVAATTLATGATTWTIAFGVVLCLVLGLLFSVQDFFVFSSGYNLLFAWCTFFARGAWLTFFTRWAWCTLFSYGCGGSSNGRRCIQRLAQFTYAFFAFATRLAVFTRCAWCTLFTRWARCALFARGLGNHRGFFADSTLFTRFAGSTFFTWSALFARFAFFVTATVAVTALLTAVATLFVARRALRGCRLLDYGRSSRLFLGGEQADQRLDQALEQAWLGDGGGRSRSDRCSSGFGWDRCRSAWRSR